MQKLESRSPKRLAELRDIVSPACHPLFRLRAGQVASWERAHRGA
jgi:hypothetical protein